MYKSGQGVDQSDATAVEWYRKAADQGHAEAQYNLGVMYERGKGVGQSDPTAAQWYFKAAEQGHADAQKNLEQVHATEKKRRLQSAELRRLTDSLEAGKERVQGPTK
jgi:TPR repeat protein